MSAAYSSYEAIMSDGLSHAIPLVPIIIYTFSGETAAMLDGLMLCRILLMDSPSFAKILLLSTNPYAPRPFVCESPTNAQVS